LGKKQVNFELAEPLGALPEELSGWDLQLADKGRRLEYTFDTTGERTGVASLISRMSELGVQFKDLETKSSSLEDIFVSLVHAPKSGTAKELQR
jgi:ABC-2 type transport system ATP-binding protein